MTCHEKWGYDDKQFVAILLGFEIHCSNCDLVAHAGRAFKLGYGEVVISHLCALNHWDFEHAVTVLKHAMDEHWLLTGEPGTSQLPCKMCPHVPGS